MPPIGALLHGLSILDLYSADERVLSVGEMARRLDMHKSSASRLAATLSAAGYLETAGAPGRYRLGSKLLGLAAIAADAETLPRIATPVLERLVATCGETGHVAVLDGVDVVTVGVVDGWHSVRMHSTVGKRSPAYATAIGKALLAALPDAEVRRRYAGRRALERRTPNTIRTVAELVEQLGEVRANGWAADREELEDGLRCVAAPITDHRGAVAGAVGLSGPSDRMTPVTLRRLGRELTKTAAEVSAGLGARAA
jgi:DNA-binding IclR family transcriptional regulator